MLLQAIKHARRAEMHSALTDIPPEEASELLRLLEAMLGGLVRAFETHERLDDTQYKS